MAQIRDIEAIDLQEDIDTLAKVAAATDGVLGGRLARLLASAQQLKQDIDDLITDTAGKFAAPQHIPAATAADLRTLRGGVCPECMIDYLIETDCEGEPVGACPGLICGTCQWGCGA